MAVYLASNHPMPLVSWDESAPAFNVTELSGDPDERVRAQFNKSYVVYAGSHEGCGCGFFKLGDPAHHTTEELDACRESLRRLADYVDAALSDSDVELFTSREGDQGEPPTIRRELTTDAIRRGELENYERQFCRIVASKV